MIEFIAIEFNPPKILNLDFDCRNTCDRFLALLQLGNRLFQPIELLLESGFFSFQTEVHRIDSFGQRFGLPLQGFIS